MGTCLPSVATIPLSQSHLHRRTPPPPSIRLSKWCESSMCEGIPLDCASRRKSISSLVRSDVFRCVFGSKCRLATNIYLCPTPCRTCQEYGIPHHSTPLVYALFAYLPSSTICGSRTYIPIYCDRNRSFPILKSV